MFKYKVQFYLGPSLIFVEVRAACELEAIQEAIKIYNPGIFIYKVEQLPEPNMSYIRNVIYVDFKTKKRVS